MSAEVSNYKQVSERKMPDKERALADYPPYKDFINKIGGRDERILRKDRLSLGLRVGISEIQDATGLSNEQVAEHVLPLLGIVDGFYAYREDPKTGKYTPAGEPSPDETTAHDFFVKHSMGPRDAAKLTEKLDEDVITTKQKAETDTDAAQLLKELGGEDGYRTTLALRGAERWVTNQIASKFIYAKER